jgi:DNA polymerase V
MPRGGKRKGAGRPKGTGKFGEPTKAIRLPVSMIDRIMQFITLKGLVLPLYSSQTSVTDTDAITETYETYDFIERLTKNSTVPILVNVQDDFMKAAGIISDDILVAYKNEVPANGNIVLAVLDNKLTIKRILRKGDKIELTTENESVPPIEFNGEEAESHILGVVKYVIHEI